MLCLACFDSRREAEVLRVKDLGKKDHRYGPLCVCALLLAVSLKIVI